MNITFMFFYCYPKPKEAKGKEQIKGKEKRELYYSISNSEREPKSVHYKKKIEALKKLYHS